MVLLILITIIEVILVIVFSFVFAFTIYLGVMIIICLPCIISERTRKGAFIKYKNITKSRV